MKGHEVRRVEELQRFLEQVISEREVCVHRVPRAPPTCLAPLKISGRLFPKQLTVPSRKETYVFKHSQSDNVELSMLSDGTEFCFNRYCRSRSQIVRIADQPRLRPFSRSIEKPSQLFITKRTTAVGTPWNELFRESTSVLKQKTIFHGFQHEPLSVPGRPAAVPADRPDEQVRHSKNSLCLWVSLVFSGHPRRAATSTGHAAISNTRIQAIASYLLR
jgi:hypothetical protein